MLWNWWLFQWHNGRFGPQQHSQSTIHWVQTVMSYRQISDGTTIHCRISTFEHFCLFNALFFWQKASLDSERIRTNEVWSVCWSLDVYVMNGCRQKGDSPSVPLLWSILFNDAAVDAAALLRRQTNRNTVKSELKTFSVAFSVGFSLLLSSFFGTLVNCFSIQTVDYGQVLLLLPPFQDWAVSGSLLTGGPTRGQSRGRVTPQDPTCSSLGQKS